MSVFRAVPVAETTTFGMPVPPSPWEGVLDCSDTVERRKLRQPTTVSVFAPAGADGDPLPVIAWIHGGRYEEGHGDDGWYDGAALASLGCVVVTLNYRKRFEGFLPINGDAPGSFRGVEDLINGLTWVQESIAGVGGDPSNVMVAGQSAGGGLIMKLLTERRADALFSRAMVMSPALPRILPRLGWRLRQATARVFLRTPLERQPLEALGAKDRRQAYRRMAKAYSSDCAVGPGPLDTGQLRAVPLLVTSMHDELVNFPGLPAIDKRMYDRRRPSWAMAPVAAALGVPRRNALRWSRQLDPRQRIGRTVTDTMIRRWAAGLLEAIPGNQVWACEFEGGDWNGTPISALHCGELPLFFDALSVRDAEVLEVCGPHADARLAETGRRFRDLVVGFAHGRDPGWAPYPGTRTTRIFSLTGRPDVDVEDPMHEVRTLLPI